MIERPIIFTGESVRAILDGRKTQTRRVVRPLTDHEELNPLAGWHLRSDGCAVAGGCAYVEETWEPRILVRRCPYGAPGDRLWVKETHYRWTGCNRAPSDWVRPPNAARYQERAYLDTPEAAGLHDHAAAAVKVPSIHMPRWASRLTLEVAEVRVQRLQEIGEADAAAEGIDTSVVTPSPRGVAPILPRQYGSARDCFADLWDAMNGKRAPWATNPWVWAITFRRIDSDGNATTGER